MADRARLSAGVVALLLSAACVSSGCTTRVATTEPMVPPPAAGAMSPVAALPRPQRALVQDFSVEPGAITLDQSIGERTRPRSSGGDQAVAEAEVASDVKEAISSSLMQAFQKMDMPAQRTDPGMVPAPPDLLERHAFRWHHLNA